MGGRDVEAQAEIEVAGKKVRCIRRVRTVRSCACIHQRTQQLQLSRARFGVESKHAARSDAEPGAVPPAPAKEAPRPRVTPRQETLRYKAELMPLSASRMSEEAAPFATLAGSAGREWIERSGYCREIRR